MNVAARPEFKGSFHFFSYGREREWADLYINSQGYDFLFFFFFFILILH